MGYDKSFQWGTGVGGGLLEPGGVTRAPPPHTLTLTHMHTHTTPPPPPSMALGPAARPVPAAPHPTNPSLKHNRLAFSIAFLSLLLSCLRLSLSLSLSLSLVCPGLAQPSEAQPGCPLNQLVTRSTCGPPREDNEAQSTSLHPGTS